MKKQSSRAVGAFGVLVLAMSAWGGGGDLMVEIPFEFSAGEKLMPAGSYVIQQRGQVLVVKNGDHGEGTLLSVVTRLARRPSENGGGANLVFDTVDGRRFLSEVWLSHGDGFLVRGTNDKHAHQFVAPN